MGIRHLLANWGTKEVEVHTSRVIHAGEPPEWVRVVHADGSASEVRVSAEDDGELNVRIDPAWRHSPHLSGGYA